MSTPLWNLVYHISIVVALASLGNYVWPDGWLRPFTVYGLFFSVALTSATTVVIQRSLQMFAEWSAKKHQAE